MLMCSRASIRIMPVWPPEWLADREGVLDRLVAAVPAPAGR